MIVSLLLLSLAATVTIEAHFTGKQIDWNFCETTKCCLSKSCWKTSKSDKEMRTWGGEESEDVDLSCNVGVQLKPFNKDTMLILFQVLNVDRGADSLALYHGETLVVECKRNNTDGVISVRGGSKGLTTISADLYENISYFDKKNALCAVVIDKSKDIADALLKDASMDDKTRLSYIAKGGAPVDITNVAKGTALFTFVRENFRCDPTLIQDGFPISGKHVLRVFDKGRVDQTLDCTNYKTSLETQFEYKLFVNTQKKSNVEVPAITCNVSQPTEIVWQYSNKEQLEYKQPFEAYCAADVTKTCSEPACASPPCPLFTPGTESAPARLACPKDRWLIEGQFVEGQKAACENHELEQNKAAFYISTLSGARVELTNTSCFEKYSCKRHSALDIAKCAPDTECEMATIDEAANRLTCPKGQLTVSHGGNETTDTAEFACDYETGVWRGVEDNATFIHPHSRITCYMARKEKEPDMTKEEIMAWQAGAALFALVIAAVISCCVGICFTKRHRIMSKVTLAAKRLENMTPEERIKHTTSVFDKAAEAAIHKDTKIKDALDMIETVVNKDVSEPEVWAAMDRFLDRLQGRLPYKSPNFGVMLARFCYLRAKQIIDKHGWKANKPITRKHPKGYIRMGAVKLLARSMGLHFHKDTQKLVVAGCLELLPDLFGEDKGPAAVYDFTRQQYPHLMGVMELAAGLSLSCAPRPNTAQAATIEALHEMVRMPNCEEWPARSDQFPEHGSVQAQAAHALGANARLYDMETVVRELLTGPTGVAQAFFQGLLDCPRHYFAQPFYVIFSCYKPADVSLGRLKAFKKLFPSDQLQAYLKNLVRIFYCFDMEYDARYLLKIINHELPDRSLTVDTRCTQNYFEEAFTRDVQSIYDWLTERMDSAELKRRPLEMAQVPPGVQDCPPGTLVEPKRKKKPWTMSGSKPKSRSPSSSASSRSSQGEGGKAKSKQTASASSSEAEQPAAAAAAAKAPPSSEDSEAARARSKASIERLQWLRKVWTDYAAGVEPPPTVRARECLASPEEQAFLRDTLYAVLNKRAVSTENYIFTPRLVELVCMHLVKVAMTEPVFIEDIPADSYIVGDIHGNLHDVMRIFQATSVDGKPGWECGRFVFLGDYVDRGTHDLEVAMVLFILKILYPGTIILLRGNHEGYSANRHNGFFEDMIYRYGKDTGMALYFTVNVAFTYLSVTAIVGGDVLVAHAGIATDNYTPGYLRTLTKPTLGSEMSFTVNEITWSDPACFIALYAVNKGRCNSLNYSLRALHIAFRVFGVKKLIRAHQMKLPGYCSYWNSDLWTVFSTSGQVDGRGKHVNHAAILFVDSQIRIHATVLELDGKHDVLTDAMKEVKNNVLKEASAKRRGGQKKEEETKEEEKKKEEQKKKEEEKNEEDEKKRAKEEEEIAKLEKAVDDEELLFGMPDDCDNDGGKTEY